MRPLENNIVEVAQTQPKVTIEIVLWVSGLLAANLAAIIGAVFKFSSEVTKLSVKVERLIKDTDEAWKELRKINSTRE